jgi:hypothetical protein
MTIDELHDAMITRFESVDSEFAKMRADMKTESEATRRHFDITE